MGPCWYWTSQCSITDFPRPASSGDMFHLGVVANVGIFVYCVCYSLCRVVKYVYVLCARFRLYSCGECMYCVCGSDSYM